MSKTKFIVADLSVMLLLLYILINNYSMIGVISYLVGSSFLFAGTLADKDKSDFGLSNKLSFYVFIITSTLFGVWFPFIQKNKNAIKSLSQDNIAGVVIGLALFVVLSLTASSDAMNPYVKRTIKYIGLYGLCLGAYSLVNPKLTHCITLGVVVIFFGLCDIYSYKTKADDPDYKSLIKPDASYWMALGINSFLIFVEAFSRGYLDKVSFYLNFKINETLSIEEINTEIMNASPLVRVDEFLSGINIFILIMVMVILAAICFYLDKTYISSECNDVYFILSVIGGIILFKTFLVNRDLITSIIFIISIIALYYIGLLLRSSRKAKLNNSHNVIRELLDKGIFVPLLFPVGITLFFSYSIYYLHKGFMVAWITLILLSILVIVIRKNLKNSWVKDSIYWQIIMVSIFVFNIVLSFVQKNTTEVLSLLVYLLVISSLVNWTVGIKKIASFKVARFTLLTKIITCFVLLVISMVAVV